LGRCFSFTKQDHSENPKINVREVFLFENHHSTWCCEGVG
jgi:hypothetical protein